MRNPDRDYDSRLKTTARKLRRNQTNVELFLWHKLRNRQLHGYKFRRQFPIAGYVVDFYCQEKKLVIELDGSQHRLKERILYDKQRTKYLQSFGINIIRFWDNDVVKNIDGVLEEILNKLTSP